MPNPLHWRIFRSKAAFDGLAVAGFSKGHA